MAHILLVEDSPDIQETVTASLPEHAVSVVGNCAQAAEVLQANRFDVIILDIVLPDGNGFGLCSSLSEATKSESSIMFLTSRDETSDKVMGLSLGADDYITKPINILEFRARLDAHLRRQTRKVEQETRFVVGDLKVDTASQRVTLLRKTEPHQELSFTHVEFKLLLHFLKHRDQVFSRDQLLATVWGESVHVFDRTVDTHVSHLRKKLSGSECSIRSVYGSGYRFTA